MLPMPPHDGLAVTGCGEPARTSHISKMVLSTVKFGGPKLTVDRTVFEMLLKL